MTTFKEQFDSLPEEQQRKLVYALNHDLTQHSELKDGRFIGVNCLQVPSLKVEQTVGVWSMGTIKGKAQ